MSTPVAEMPTAARRVNWKWWVCGLLLLATMLNYMDRLTLNLMSKQIMEDFRFDELHYGYLESAFAFAFAIGAILFGWLADRISVRWLYPLALLAWSAAGFATGLAAGFVGLLVCRFFLGLTESAHWPCALRTTQHILPREQRASGNGILQSGAAVGAILTPLIVLAMVTPNDVLPGNGSWRYPFMVIGVLGFGWAGLWLWSVRSADLEMTGRRGPSLMSILAVLLVLLALDVAIKMDWIGEPAGWFPWDLQLGGWEWQISFKLCTKMMLTVVGIGAVYWWLQGVTGDEDLPRPLFLRRFWVLVVVVVMINTAWHFFRAWLPLILQNQHGYAQEDTYWFVLAYYVATDLGSLTAGFAALTLAGWGMSVHGSRMTVFLFCTLLTSLSVIVAILPAGWLLLGLLLIIGFGALGLFPQYYSFSQELTTQHQGKLTGALGCINWLAMSLLHEVVGDSVKQTGNYSQGVCLAGLAPLLGLLVLLLFWGRSPATEPEPVKVPA